MTTIIASLLLFLAAFAAMALGVIIKKKSIHGGCGSAKSSCCKHSKKC